MEKKIDNPVSRSIVESICNQFGEYLPVICPPLGKGQGWAIGARLPEEHKKWIAHINGNPGFREIIKLEIESVFSRYIFGGRSYLKISFSTRGTAFETDGVNGCMIYVSPDSAMGCSYSYHHIDTFEQAMILFIALSVYLPKLYSALENFESGEYDPKDFPPLEERIDETVKWEPEGGLAGKKLCDTCGANISTDKCPFCG